MTSALLIMAAAMGAAVTFVAPAHAGEGHWSIGKGVQCRLVLGVRICSKSRP